MNDNSIPKKKSKSLVYSCSVGTPPGYHLNNCKLSNYSFSGKVRRERHSSVGDGDIHHRFIISRDPRLLKFGSRGCSIEDLEVNPQLAFVKFLRGHKCYDIVPNSSKLVIFDTKLNVKKAFLALVYNSVRAAPLWDSDKHELVGMLTISDFIHILQRHYRSPDLEIDELEHSRICEWKQDLGHSAQNFVYIEPEGSLFEAVMRLVQHKVHRLPVICTTTGNPLYILTHKRILKFLYLYMAELPQPPFMLRTLREAVVGTYTDIATISHQATLLEALSIFIQRGVSALPVVDPQGRLIDLYAKFDVVHLAAKRTYNQLNMTLSEALTFRSPTFEGVVTCHFDETLEVVVDRLVRKEVHRLIVVDSSLHVLGVVSLSDILTYFVTVTEGSCNRHSGSSTASFTGDTLDNTLDNMSDSVGFPYSLHSTPAELLDIMPGAAMEDICVDFDEVSNGLGDLSYGDINTKFPSCSPAFPQFPLLNSEAPTETFVDSEDHSLTPLYVDDATPMCGSGSSVCVDKTGLNSPIYTQ